MNKNTCSCLMIRQAKVSRGLGLSGLGLRGLEEMLDIPTFGRDHLFFSRRVVYEFVAAGSQ